MTSPKKIDLLGLGISPVDFFVSMKEYPPCGKKIDGITGSNLIAGGGPVPTALCTFSKLGGRSAVISCYGDDKWGRFARKELERFKVDHRHCIIRKNCTSALAFAWVEMKSGDRTIVLDMDPRLTIKPTDLKLNLLPHPKLIHIDGRFVPACVKLARWGRKIGAKIMLDVGSVRNKVDELFPYINYLVCADQYALHFWKTKSIRKAAEKFKNLGIAEVTVTSGIKGSYGIDGEGQSCYQKTYKVQAVDVTGAGDVFHGSYLYGLHREWDLPYRLKFASAAAALKCRSRGARDGIPSLTKVLNFIKNHRIYHA